MDKLPLAVPVIFLYSILEVLMTGSGLLRRQNPVAETCAAKIVAKAACLAEPVPSATCLLPTNYKLPTNCMLPTNCKLPTNGVSR